MKTLYIPPTERYINSATNSAFAKSETKPEDILQCALTCRSWKQSTCGLLYTNVQLRSEQDIDDFLLICVKDKSLAKHVRDLDTSQFELDPLAKMSVNVEKIRLGLEDDDIEDYNSAQEDTLFSRLFELIGSGKFPRLEELPLPQTEHQCKMYAKCTDLRKENMSLDIKIDVDDVGTHISVPDNIETIAQKNKLLELHSLSIELEGQLNTLRLSGTFNATHPMPSLENLKIITMRNFSIVDDTFMLYIMKKFPNLKNLTVTQKGYYYFFGPVTNRVRVSINTTARFLTFLLKLSKYEIVVATKEKTAKIIKKLYTNLGIQNKTPGQFPTTVRMGYENEIKSDKLQLPLVILKMWWRFDMDRWPLSIKFDSRNTSGQQETEIIEQSGQYFKRLTLCDVPLSVYGLLLKYIAEYCTSLEYLDSLHCPKIENLELDNLPVNRNLTKLGFTGSGLTPDKLSIISSLFPSVSDVIIRNDTLKRHGSESSLVLSMPKLSLKTLKFFFSFRVSRSLLPPISIDELCIKVRSGENRRYFFLTFQTSETAGGVTRYIGSGGYLLQFVKELDGFEFENLEDGPQYFVCLIGCKSLETFSLNYSTKDEDYTGDYYPKSKSTSHLVHFV